MPQIIYFLDLMGTFAFAIYGSYFALKKNFDILGITICALLTALGGGTLREIILDQLPFYFFDYNYFLMIVAGIIFAIAVFKNFRQIEPLILIMDAIGLVTFAFIGAARSSDLNLGFFAIVMIATISAVGGGVMRDLLLQRVPEIMYRDFYASVAVILGSIYALFSPDIQESIWAIILILSCFAIRLLAIYFRINLWRPREILSKIAPRDVKIID